MSTFKFALAAGVASLLLSSSALGAEEAKPAAPAAAAPAAKAEKKVEKKVEAKADKKAGKKEQKAKKGKQEGEKAGYGSDQHYRDTQNRYIQESLRK